MPPDAPNEVYEYTFIGGDQNVYSFSTADRIDYNVKFVPSTYLFDAYPELDIEVFEMIISVADNPTGKRIPSDSRVGPTIALIFNAFIQHEKQAIIFVCDSSDGRQKARSRKFTTWFQNRQTGTDMGKIDRLIIDGDRFIYLSLILFRKHPQFKTVVDVFINLGEEDK